MNSTTFRFAFAVCCLLLVGPSHAQAQMSVWYKAQADDARERAKRARAAAERNANEGFHDLARTYGMEAVNAEADARDYDMKGLDAYYDEQRQAAANSKLQQSQQSQQSSPPQRYSDSPGEHKGASRHLPTESSNVSNGWLIGIGVVIIFLLLVNITRRK
jgi:hypothetical protein